MLLTRALKTLGVVSCLFSLQQQLFILLGARRSADDPYKCKRSWDQYGGWSLFASSLPVVPQMLLFMLLPGDLLADLCQSLFLEIGANQRKDD